MAITNYDLTRDVISTEVLTKTNYEITSATAAQERKRRYLKQLPIKQLQRKPKRKLHKYLYSIYLAIYIY